jgi:hypothetical protein
MGEDCFDFQCSQSSDIQRVLQCCPGGFGGGSAAIASEGFSPGIHPVLFPAIFTLVISYGVASTLSR